MSTQSLLDFTDIAIIAAFISATVALIVYLWRGGRSSSHHRGRLS